MSKAILSSSLTLFLFGFLLVEVASSNETAVREERFEVTAVCDNGFDIALQSNGGIDRGRISYQNGDSTYSGIEVGEMGLIRLFTEKIVSGRVQVKLKKRPWREGLIQMGADPNC